MSESRGLFAVRRAETGAGADYYVAPAWTALRLEVSVWTEGPVPAVERRLRDTVEQASGGRSNLPAMARPLPRFLKCA
jgi:hypothetical protein